MKISIVSPVYNAEIILEELIRRIKLSIPSDFSELEIVLVDDGSPDNSWVKILDLCRRYSDIKGIKLSRNFGQHYAITAGLDNATGDWIVVMDCDLQDQPEEIEKLFNKAKEGFDIVFARRRVRKDKYIKRTVSKFFYWLFNFLTDLKSDHTISNFGIYKDIIVKEYCKIKERDKVFPIVIRQIGFKSESIDVIHGRRIFGESSYSLSKLIKLAVRIIITQSNKPLYLSIYFGFLIALLAFIYGIFLIVRYFFLDVPLGYTSIIATILFTGGLLFCNLGLIGIYLGKVFNEVKERPAYIVEDSTFK